MNLNVDGVALYDTDTTPTSVLGQENPALDPPVLVDSSGVLFGIKFPGEEEQNMKAPGQIELVLDKHCQFSPKKKQHELVRDQVTKISLPGKPEWVLLYVNYANRIYADNTIRNNAKYLEKNPNNFCVIRSLEQRAEYSPLPVYRKGYTVKIYPEYNAGESSTTVAFVMTCLSTDSVNGDGTAGPRNWMLHAELPCGRKQQIPIQVFAISRDPARHRKDLRDTGRRRRRRSTSSSTSSTASEEPQPPNKVIKTEVDGDVKEENNNNSDNSYYDSVVSKICERAGAQADEALMSTLRFNVHSFVESQVNLLSFRVGQRSA